VAQPAVAIHEPFYLHQTSDTCLVEQAIINSLFLEDWRRRIGLPVGVDPSAHEHSH
jgi:hypothetical protein